MKLSPTMIFARIAFYTGLLAIVGAALTVTFPDWQRYGITAGGLLQLANTFLLVSIAVLLAATVETR